MGVFAQVAQAPVATPDIAWSTISPELVLFGVGILVLMLDTAGRRRQQVSFAVAGVAVVGSAVAWYQAAKGGGDAGVVPTVAGLVALFGIGQFALTALWRDRPRTLAAILTASGFVGALVATGWLWSMVDGQLTAAGGTEAYLGTGSFLADMVAVDGVAIFTRITVCIAGLVTVPLGFAYLEDRRIHRGEYYPLLLCTATGMTLLGSAADLLMVFIAIEVLSLGLYVLCGIARRDLNAQESALKYFLLGAFSSALLLYGIAVLYGASGTTNIADVGRALTALTAPTGLAIAGMALLIVGFAFKTAIVPFHMWTPDVYQGAPTPVTAFMAAATKAAAFAAFIRVFVGALAPLGWTWVPVIAVLSAITMIVGAVLAVVQTDVKRMLAYSAIAHAGYVAIGMTAVLPENATGATGRAATSAMLLYLLVYALMSLGSFGVLALFERRARRSMTLADLRGVGRRYPAPAMLMGLFLISLAGIPLTAGFTAKLAVFRSGIEAGQIWLVVIGVVSSVVAAFFYIRVIASMFVEDEPAEAAVLPALEPTTGTSIALALSAAAVIAIGVFPSNLIGLVERAATFAT